MHHASVRRSSAGRYGKQLRAAENQAVVVRKLLRRLKGRLPRGVTADAERLARAIESLARLGRRSTAVNAVDLASRLERLTFLLGCEVDSFFTS